MSRNSEKAQSMLYRFREQQAQEMGLGGRQKGERRPRMASSVSSLRECERWRADILKEISRKVSKIQDCEYSCGGLCDGCSLYGPRRDCSATRNETARADLDGGLGAWPSVHAPSPLWIAIRAIMRQLRSRWTRYRDADRDISDFAHKANLYQQALVRAQHPCPTPIGLFRDHRRHHNTRLLPNPHLHSPCPSRGSTDTIASLTDYEVRDLNDDINQLMREKRHWETQIVNLGGANYKRATGVMVDDAGKEVPGTRGYKYFGRARDLPGVREMFQKGGK